MPSLPRGGKRDVGLWRADEPLIDGACGAAVGTAALDTDIELSLTVGQPKPAPDCVYPASSVLARFELGALVEACVLPLPSVTGPDALRTFGLGSSGASYSHDAWSGLFPCALALRRQAPHFGRTASQRTC